MIRSGPVTRPARDFDCAGAFHELAALHVNDGKWSRDPQMRGRGGFVNVDLPAWL